MKPPIEDPNIKLTEDTDVFGTLHEKGAKITIVSKQGEFNGRRVRVPPPEFEALMLQTAVSSASKAADCKKSIRYSESIIDSILALDIDDENHLKFFEFCKCSMSSIAFSVSAAESWANKSIASLGEKNNEPMKLILERPGKSDREVLSNSVASDRSVLLVPKLFQLVPQVFGVEKLRESSTLKKNIKELIDDRNIVMHMQQKLTIEKIERERTSFAVKLFSSDPFKPSEGVLKYMNYIYDHSSADAPEWLTDLWGELNRSKRKAK
jgi:hypothetical protein